MLFDTWKEWKVEAKKQFMGHEPDPQHLLSQVKISQFSALQPFIVKFQEYANKVLAQQTKGFSGTERKLIIDNFHSLVVIPTFEKALTPAYAGLIRKANPSTLEEAYNLVCENYTIYVKREEDEDVKATSKWNPFAMEAKKKEPSTVEKLEAKIKEMQNRFEAIYLAHEHPSRVTGYRQAQHNAPFTCNCYNCNKQGHKSERCTAPCSICNGTNHSNYRCSHCIHTNVQRPIAVMMSEQFYQTEKRPLSTPKGVSPLNKKTNSDYIIDHNGPALSPLIKPRYIRSCAPSPDQDYTPPPLKRHEREANPSPEELPIDSEGLTIPESQATAELIDEVYEEGTHASCTTHYPLSPYTTTHSV
ncbi:hypothetical protein DSO57_1005360 [Entomophthora muscae]|uniref:Uncharacterized protein n=1 Tax=Entomophthora muscae TaxID=34485 RepID=A0ACC2RMR9_9FUNG|nr:hypothetical protein DSO57_1005360 [Entomophthora muscae]